MLPVDVILVLMVEFRNSAPGFNGLRGVADLVDLAVLEFSVCLCQGPLPGRGTSADPVLRVVVLICLLCILILCCVFMYLTS